MRKVTIDQIFSRLLSFYSGFFAALVIWLLSVLVLLLITAVSVWGRKGVSYTEFLEPISLVLLTSSSYAIWSQILRQFALAVKSKGTGAKHFLRRVFRLSMFAMGIDVLICVLFLSNPLSIDSSEITAFLKKRPGSLAEFLYLSIRFSVVLKNLGPVLLPDLHGVSALFLGLFCQYELRRNDL